MSLFNKIITSRKNIILFLNYFVVLFALLMPINAHLGRKVFSVIFVFWLLSVDYKTIISSLKENRIFSSIVLFSIFFISSILWSEDTAQAIKWIQAYLKYFFLPIIVFTTTIKYNFLKYIIVAFIFSMMFNEVVSYSIYFTDIKEVFGFSVTGNKFNPIPFQVSHIPYSLFVAFVIFLSFYNITHKTNTYFKIITSVFIVTMIANLFLSSGRTGQFMFAMTALSFIIIYFTKNIKALITSILLIIFIFFMAYNFSNTFQARVEAGKGDLNKVFYSNSYNSSFGVRLGSYVVLPTLMSNNNVLIGTGIGDIQKAVDIETSKKFGDESVFSVQKGLLHNTFLEILISLGLIGFVIFIYFLYLIFISKHENQHYKYISYLVFFTIVFSGLSASFFSFKEIMFMLSLFIPIIIVSNKNKI